MMFRLQPVAWVPQGSQQHTLVWMSCLSSDYPALESI